MFHVCVVVKIRESMKIKCRGDELERRVKAEFKNLGKR
jgi:hypothetical protein